MQIVLRWFWLWGSVVLSSLSCWAALIPNGSGFPDSLHVAAHPHLNLRNADRTAILGMLEDGTAIASTRLARTGRKDTIGGLTGEWLALDDTLRIFDAYLWVVDPPAIELLECADGRFLWTGESVEAYGRRVVGSPQTPVFRTISEDYGGPSGDAFELEVLASPGAALNIFRRFLLSTFEAQPRRRLDEDQRNLHDRIFEGTWDGVQMLDFHWSSEGGGCTLSLRPIPTTEGGYILSFSSATC